MKILSPRAHGYIDYAAILLLAVAPSLLDFGGLPATLCYAVAGIYFVMVLLTAYPLGAIKIIPFPVHGAVEIVLAPMFAVLPWLAGFADLPVARNFFLVMAAALLGVWLVTNYRAADYPGHPAQRSHA